MLRAGATAPLKPVSLTHTESIQQEVVVRYRQSTSSPPKCSIRDTRLKLHDKSLRCGKKANSEITRAVKRVPGGRLRVSNTFSSEAVEKIKIRWERRSLLLMFIQREPLFMSRV